MVQLLSFLFLDIFSLAHILEISQNFVGGTAFFHLNLEHLGLKALQGCQRNLTDLTKFVFIKIRNKKKKKKTFLCI